MKIILKISIVNPYCVPAFIVTLSLMLFSCSKYDSFEKLKSSNKFGEFTITKEINNNLLNSVFNYDSKNSKTASSKNTSVFDLDDPSLISIENSDLRAISIPEINNSNPNLKREKSFIIDKNGEIAKFIITEINFISETEIEVKYLNENGELVNYYSIDAKNKSIEFLFLEPNDRSKKILLQKGCGQAIVDCMSDKYTKNGRDSVFLSIGTAFFPEVAVGVAVICAYESDECS